MEPQQESEQRNDENWSEQLDAVPAETLPKHIAIIMDGNGRWARRQDLARIEGHRNGVNSVRRVLEECVRLNISQLTLYCLSSENWKRPEAEVSFLMHLLQQYMIEERALIMEQNVVVKVIGRRSGIPDDVQAEVDKTIELSCKNTGTCLCLAINYGGRAELVDAVRELSGKVAANEISVDSIDEQMISNSLYTAGMPDPDLMIRTAGEMRISNFLLWQISYAELWVTQRCWPEFRIEDLHHAMVDFSKRDRRYGGLNLSNPDRK